MPATALLMLRWQTHFRLDYVGTKAGIKGASVVMGYLETGMRTLDAVSGSIKHEYKN